MNTRIQSLLAGSALLTIGLLSTVGASAQQLTGFGLQHQSDASHLIGLYEDRSLASEAILATWRAEKPAADRRIEQMIADNQASYGKGITLYNQVSTLASNGEASAQWVEKQRNVWQIVVHLVLKNNVIVTKSTTPSVFGSYADPKFSITYDVDIQAVIPVPTEPHVLSVSSATLTVSNARLDPHNIPAGILDAFNSVNHFFGGPDFKSRAEQSLTQTVSVASDVNKMLAPFNNAVNRFLGSQALVAPPLRSDGWFPISTPQGNTLVLKATRGTGGSVSQRLRDIAQQAADRAIAIDRAKGAEPPVKK